MVLDEEGMERMLDGMNLVETEDRFYKWIIEQYNPLFKYIDKIQK